MMSTSRQWQPNIGVLAEHFHLVLIELWGHGSSPAPADPDAYGAAGLVAAVDEVRTRFGVGRWALVGHSFGGAVALRYALERPGHTRSVLFTNSLAALSPATAEAARESADRIADDRDPRTLPLHPVHARRIPAPLHDQLVLDADRTDLAALRQLIAAHPQVSVRSDLHRIAVPATLVNGRFERRFQPNADLIRARHPGIRVIDVDAGHSPNIEAADDFNRIAVESLAPAGS
jgi:pimeloyl-ACP methyl ester carboxylesterase